MFSLSFFLSEGFSKHKENQNEIFLFYFNSNLTFFLRTCNKLRCHFAEILFRSFRCIYIFFPKRLQNVVYINKLNSFKSLTRIRTNLKNYNRFIELVRCLAKISIPRGFRNELNASMFGINTSQLVIRRQSPSGRRIYYQPI